MTRTEVRWVLLPFKVALAFVLVGFAATFVAGELNVWYEPFAGFFVAFAVVAIAYLSAPRWKLPVAGASFILGAWFAYQLLKDSFYPESYPAPYESTLKPFWVTMAGGALALSVVAVHTYLQRSSPSNKSFERMRER